MDIVREKLELPEGGKKLLLHACCATCPGEIMEAIIWGISQWKDMGQINKSGIPAASHYKGLNYWTYKWWTENGKPKTKLRDKYYGASTNHKLE